MAYKFTDKKSSKQQQNTYALYMMLSSYFNKSICNSKSLETSLRLYYQELPATRQEALEAKMIADIERELKDVLPVLGKMNCNVVIRRQAGEYQLSFETGFEVVSAAVDPKGRYRIQVLRGTENSPQIPA
ncbi:MAG: hypothetical protein E7292_10465 [Lachnospiraceae bacterium]|nr:hypothetical protein [Lachnospiraceae bacterium]